MTISLEALARIMAGFCKPGDNCIQTIHIVTDIVCHKYNEYITDTGRIDMPTGDDVLFDIILKYLQDILLHKFLFFQFIPTNTLNELEDLLDSRMFNQIIGICINSVKYMSL
jgi:hypothetical protein